MLFKHVSNIKEAEEFNVSKQLHEVIFNVCYNNICISRHEDFLWIQFVY